MARLLPALEPLTRGETTGRDRERSLLIDDAAAALGVSRRTVYYRIREGQLRTVRTPCGSQRVLVSSIDELRATPRPRRKRNGVTSTAVAAVLAPANWNDIASECSKVREDEAAPYPLVERADPRTGTLRVADGAD